MAGMAEAKPRKPSRGREMHKAVEICCSKRSCRNMLEQEEEPCLEHRP